MDSHCWGVGSSKNNGFRTHQGSRQQAGLGSNQAPAGCVCRTKTVGRWLTEGGILARIFGLFFTNPLVLWFCAGISKGQLSLIRKEDNIYRSA